MNDEERQKQIQKVKEAQLELEFAHYDSLQANLELQSELAQLGYESLEWLLDALDERLKQKLKELQA